MSGQQVITEYVCIVGVLERNKNNIMLKYNERFNKSILISWSSNGSTQNLQKYLNCQTYIFFLNKIPLTGCLKIVRNSL